MAFRRYCAGSSLSGEVGRDVSESRGDMERGAGIAPYGEACMHCQDKIDSLFGYTPISLRLIHSCILYFSTPETLKCSCRSTQGNS
jgi:hypothetical protein